MMFKKLFQLKNIRTITFLCFVSIVTSHISQSEKFCSIQTESGQVRGVENRTLFENQIYYSFRGIPFAESPLNDLRFKVNSTIKKHLAQKQIKINIFLFHC